eukprot:Gb_25892 [translate_table: standard]
MGSCMSKKEAKKLQQSTSSDAYPDSKGTQSSPSLSQTTPAFSTLKNSPPKEKPPPEEEAVKEILSETSKTNHNNNSKSADDGAKEKSSTEEGACMKNPEHNSSLKKKGSFKKDQSKKDQVVQGGSSLTRSSSAKEDVDAILIQCGRLSRSSSGKASNETHSRNQYSGSKRLDVECKEEEVDTEKAKENRARPSHRRSSSRDLTVETKRSSSRDRGTEGGKRVTGRRISPSPGRRAEPSPGRRSEKSAEKTRPGKQSSIASRENASNSEARVVSKRGPVKRTAASGDFSAGNTSTSRSRSPAPRLCASNECSFPQSLSRSSSRKTEQSPFRRPLNDEMTYDQSTVRKDEETNNDGSQGETAKRQTTEKLSTAQMMDETETKRKRVALKEISGNCKPIRDQLLSCRAVPTMKAPSKVSTKEAASDEISCTEETETVKPSATSSHKRVPSFGTEMNGENEAFNEFCASENCVEKQHLSNGATDQYNGNPSSESGAKSEGLSMQFPRSRSARRSRDQFLLDSQSLFEAANPPLQYANTELKAFSIPASLSKACFILEAVADLNSSVNSNSSMYSNEKSLVSDSLEQGKSTRFLAMPNFESEEKLSANSDTERAGIIREFHRTVSARNSNVEWTEQVQEESAGSNDNIMYQSLLAGRVAESANRLTTRRLHKFLSSEEDLTSFSNEDDLAKSATGRFSNGDENNINHSRYLKQSNARYFNINPQDVILNPHLGIEESSGESLGRSNLVPVITLSKKEFQSGKRPNNVQNGRAISEQQMQNVRHHHQNYYTDQDFKADSRATSDPGKQLFLTNSLEDQCILKENSTNSSKLNNSSSTSATNQMPKELAPAAASIHPQKNDLAPDEPHQHITLSPADILYLLENAEYDEEELLCFMNNNAKYGGGRRSHCSENASSEASFEFKIKSVSSTPRSTPSFSTGSTPCNLRNSNSFLLTAEEIAEIWGAFESIHYLNSP